MTIHVSDPDFTLHVGDVREILRTLPDGSVDCVVTSPPYWGLRDYGTGDQQIGLEATPAEFVAALVDVFREVFRVLTPTGTCWLNLGDSYASAWACDRRNVVGSGSLENGKRADRPNRLVGGLKEKDLVGIPWRVALALQDDGWYLRSDVIWAKPNPMPESVTDRPTKSHEYVFLLTKQSSYWFDQEAAREPHSPDGRKVTTVVAGDGSIQHRDGERWPNSGRNIRSVWEIPTQAYSGAHFATYPQELVRRCVIAGCAIEVCRVCGKPRERMLERGESDYARMKAKGVDWRDMHGTAVDEGKGHDSNRAHIGGTRDERGKAFSYTAAERTDLGWSDCGHGDYRRGVVLDPFIGSGTTALVAREQGRCSVGIELNPEYAKIAADRLSQQSLFA